MAVSEKELNALMRFYVGLRKAVFVAGIVVMVAAVLGVIVAAFILGQRNAAPAVPAVADSDRPKAQPEKPAAPRPVRHRRIAPPPEPVIEEPEPDHPRLGEDGPAPVITEIPAPAPLAASPVVVLVPEPVPDFSVTVHPKKHRWPRRFFGAIGRGLGKAVGVR